MLRSVFYLDVFHKKNENDYASILESRTYQASVFSTSLFAVGVSPFKTLRLDIFVGACLLNA